MWDLGFVNKVALGHDFYLFFEERGGLEWNRVHYY
jgi:hypothetical protein